MARGQGPFLLAFHFAGPARAQALYAQYRAGKDRAPRPCGDADRAQSAVPAVPAFPVRTVMPAGFTEAVVAGAPERAPSQGRARARGVSKSREARILPKFVRYLPRIPPGAHRGV